MEGRRTSIHRATLLGFDSAGMPASTSKAGVPNACREASTKYSQKWRARGDSARFRWCNRAQNSFSGLNLRGFERMRILTLSSLAPDAIMERSRSGRKLRRGGVSYPGGRIATCVTKTDLVWVYKRVEHDHFVLRISFAFFRNCSALLTVSSAPSSENFRP